MGRRPLLLLLPFLFLPLLSSYSGFAFSFGRPSLPPNVGKNQREFDYFMLALQWPGTYCRKTTYCCPTNGCCLKSGPLTEFTIHGLWPDYNDGTWPSCCSNAEFDIEKVSSLLGTLQQYWPSLSCSKSSLCNGGKGLFWAHEWGKHGTCSSPVIKDEFSYFSTVLDLYFKYNITKILDDAGFQASVSKSYAFADVIQAIKESIGAAPQIICSHGNVEEIRICLNKDFKPRECTAASTFNNDMLKSSCPKRISLPTYGLPVSPSEDARIQWMPVDEAFSSLTMVA